MPLTLISMIGFGWCHLLTSRESLRNATPADAWKIDARIAEGDHLMFAAFRKWMSEQRDPFLIWTLSEANNNHNGLLTYSLSRNHRSSLVWGMLEWIRVNAVSSYGLFYCHDDEDTKGRNAYGRLTEEDYTNVYRVHRLRNGKLEELADPFFGSIEGGLVPVHPEDRDDASGEG